MYHLYTKHNGYTCQTSEFNHTDTSAAGSEWLIWRIWTIPGGLVEFKTTRASVQGDEKETSDGED